MDTTPRLWLDKYIVLDATGGRATIWRVPREEYLDFGDANQAYFAWEYHAVGPGAADLQMTFERTSLQVAKTGTDVDELEDMNLTPISLTRGHGWGKWVFGRDHSAVGDRYPRGLGALELYNSSSTGTDWAAVRLRVWATLQEA